MQEGQVVSPGQRPFEILSQRSEDDFPVPLSIPDNWPKHVQKIWSKRLEVLKGSKRLQIIEDAHYKRRWIGRQGLFKHTANADEFRSELGRFLLAKLEGLFDVDNRMNDTATTRFDPAVCSVARIANAVQADEQFQKVGEAYTGDAAFDVTELVSELVERESVPHLPTLRYKASGLRKRQEWEETWGAAAAGRRHRCADGVADGRPAIPHERTSDAIEETGSRRYSRTSEIQEQRFSEGSLLAVARQARCAQRTLGEFPLLRRPGRHPS